MWSRIVIILHVWMTLVRVSNPTGVIIVEEGPGEFIHKTFICLVILIRSYDFSVLYKLLHKLI